MATAKIAYRKNAIGISAGLGIALPLAAYAVTLPLNGVNEVVRTDAMPFAAGILVGVGMLAATGHLLEAHAEEFDMEEAGESHGSHTTSASSARVAPDQRNGTTAEGSERRGSRFARAVSDDVPVISRAANALDDAAAWAEIDAMVNEDSPISCDPARSNDMYRIAFEELRRSAAASAATSAAVATAAAGAPANARVAPRTTSAPASTAMYMSLAGAPQQQSSAPVYAASSPFAATPVMPFDDLDEASDYQAAMESLYGAQARIPQRPIAPASAPAAATPTATPAAPVATPVVSVSKPAPNVPIADYSGHEDMWVAALAILDDEVPSVSEMHAATEALAADMAREAAVAEGANATKLHSHVNSLVEEEFERAESKSVRHTTHEYLKVIEGGTASMPALKRAEA